MISDNYEKRHTLKQIGLWFDFKKKMWYIPDTNDGEVQLRISQVRREFGRHVGFIGESLILKDK
jgi:hypothetical protein